MITNNYCTICGEYEPIEPQKITLPVVPEQKDVADTSFAILLALVPAMTMTLFNVMGLI